MSHLQSTQEEFVEFLKTLAIEVKGLSILDVGCKNDTCVPFFQWTLHMQWTGIDNNPEKYAKHNRLLKMDMINLQSLYGNNFDFIFVCHSLEHCENPIQALKEFKKVLKEDGWLFISLPCPCKHHVLESDNDHLFCFNEMQIERLLTYTEWKNIKCYKGLKGGYGDTGMYNVIGVGQK
ncbi:MAG: class I SAM-dependent methyltransferase [Nanoarchaeota archaeon]